MRITFLSPPLNMGGGSRVLAIYAEALMKMGHEVLVVSPPHRGIPLINKLKSSIKGQGWPPAPSSYFERSAVPQFVTNQHRPIVDSDVPDGDVVVATWWETAEWVNALSPSKGAKVYFIQHHEVFDHLPGRSRDTYRMPLHKIVIAQWLKDLMRTEYGDATADLVPNSVDRYQFYAPPRPMNKTPTVGLLYSTIKFKGLDTSIAAINLLRTRLPKLNVIAFGSERKKRAYKLPARSSFYFNPSQDRIRELYQRCDVWLTSSRTEGFNLPALEAMACATPVVSTRTGWPAEGIVNEVNGILAEVDDTRGVASGLEWVLTRDDRQWQHLSQGAYRTMASPTWKHSSALFEETLQRAAMRTPPTSCASVCC